MLKLLDIKLYEQQREPYQTDYQFRASAVVAEAIYRKGMGLEPGPRYVSMPVGCGKTTGAIWGIVRFAQENPDKKICFLTPYVKGVKDQFAKLKAELGKENVGRFYGGASGDKSEQLKKPVFVCTHQFGSYNLAKLQDRDLVVVDEAFYGSGDVQLSLGSICNAMDWARRQGILADEFRSVFEMLNGFVQRQHIGDGFLPIDPADIGYDLSLIAKYDFSEVVNPFGDVERIGEFQSFCAAMLEGRAFAAHKKDGQVTFVSGALDIPSMENTVVLTATGGMTYEAVGTFTEIPLVKRSFVAPRYDQLTLVRLSDPEINGSYRSWRSSKIKPKVISYVEWVLEQVAEGEIYLSVPKSIFDGCLTDFFGFGSKATVDLPTTVQKDGKTIHLSHHHVGIGSNSYKDCKAVVYLWDNHIPKLASVRKYHVLSGEKVSTSSLQQANNGDLRGPFAKVRDASLVENVMQQIGRGAIRQIDGSGQAGQMKAYVLAEPKTFGELKLQMKGSQTVDCDGFGRIRRPSGRVRKVLEFLQENTGADLKASEVQKSTGTNINRVKKELENLEEQLQNIGFRFQKGRRGRGNEAMFIWISESEDSNYTKIGKAA